MSYLPVVQGSFHICWRCFWRALSQAILVSAVLQRLNRIMGPVLGTATLASNWGGACAADAARSELDENLTAAGLANPSKTKRLID